MAAPNPFRLLAVIDEEDQIADVYDAEDLGVLKDFADPNGPAPVAKENQNPRMLVGPRRNPRNPNAAPEVFDPEPAVAPVAKFTPAPQKALVADPLPPAVFAPEQDLAAEENQNPWILVGPRRNPRNPNAAPEVFDPEPAVKVCDLEVLWEPTLGSVRSERKWAQARKSGYTTISDGLAYFTY